MTPKEIVHRVRRNGGTHQYLNILADLNSCAISEIESILKRNGFKKEKGVWKLLPPEVPTDQLKARALNGYFVRDYYQDVAYCPAGRQFKRVHYKNEYKIQFAKYRCESCKDCKYQKDCLFGTCYKNKFIFFTKDLVTEQKANWWREESLSLSEKSTGQPIIVKIDSTKKYKFKLDDYPIPKGEKLMPKKNNDTKSKIIPMEIKKQIYDAYVSGKTVKELIDEYNVSETSVRTIIKKFGTSGNYHASNVLGNSYGQISSAVPSSNSTSFLKRLDLEIERTEQKLAFLRATRKTFIDQFGEEDA